MKIKRIISMLLCIVMVISCITVTAKTDANKYIASQGFSLTQGNNNWYYKCRNSSTDAVSEHTSAEELDETTVWRSNGGNGRGYVGTSTMLPGIEPSVAFDAIREFVVPEEGKIIIGTNGEIGAKDTDIANAFGVKIRILHNGTTVYPASGDWVELQSRSDVVTITNLPVIVAQNDTISFEARRTINLSTAGEMRQNIIKWDPVISYADSIEPKHDCDITEFLLGDAVGVIDGNVIEVSVPSNIDITNLKAEFVQSDMAKVYVNSIEQTSGKTANDYTNDVKYEVIAEDGTSKKEYIVKVYFKDNDALASYNSKDNFSDTQGKNNWSYMYRNLNEGEFSQPIEYVYNSSSWSEGRWCTSETGAVADFGFVANDRIHPGKIEATPFSAMRVFAAPKSGKITISKDGDIKSSLTSADFNVKIRILKNDTVLWPEDGGWESITSDTAQSQFSSVLVDVSKWDKIIFEVCADGKADAVNSLSWVSKIEYLPTEDFALFERNEETADAVEIGGTNWLDYSIEGKFNLAVQDAKTADIEFLKDYAIKISKDKVLILKAGEIEKTAFVDLDGGIDYSFEISTEKHSDGIMISLFIDGNPVAMFKDVNADNPKGKIIVNGNSVNCFSDIKILTAVEKTELENVNTVKTALEIFNLNKNTENYKNVISALDKIQDEKIKEMLKSLFEEYIQDFKYIQAVANTADRKVKIEGLDYDRRNSTLEIVIAEEDGYSVKVNCSVDEKGVISGEIVLDLSVQSGILIVKTADGKLSSTFEYRKKSSECELISFYLDGVYGVIKDNKVTVNLTKKTDITEMIPKYEVSEFAKVYIDGKEQINGKTENNFTNSLKYKIVAEDGTEKTYTVTVIPKESGSSGGTSVGRGNGGVSSSRGEVVQNISVDHNLIDKTEEQADYSDVATYRWSYEYIKGLTEKNIISGNGNGMFEPERNITRAEFVKMLMLALNIKNDGLPMDFEDVSAQDWYYEYVQAAYSKGIVEGYDGYFGANDKITRQDMAVMICRSGANLEFVKEPEDFEDMEDVSDYALESIKALSKANILNGDNDKILPKENATREQAAKMIYLVM